MEPLPALMTATLSGRSWLMGVEDAREMELSFESTNYPIRLQADGGWLVWSVPTEYAIRRGVPASYESSVERLRIGSDVELWSFAKDRTGERRHVLLFVNPGAKIALSVELVVTNPPQSRSRTILLRGRFSSAFEASGLAAFPRRRPPTRRLLIRMAGGDLVMKFGASGELVSLGDSAASSPRRAVGMVIDLGGGASMVQWQAGWGCGSIVLHGGLVAAWTLAAGEDAVRLSTGKYDNTSDW